MQLYYFTYATDETELDFSFVVAKDDEMALKKAKKTIKDWGYNPDDVDITEVKALALMDGYKITVSKNEDMKHDSINCINSKPCFECEYPIA